MLTAKCAGVPPMCLPERLMWMTADRPAPSGPVPEPGPGHAASLLILGAAEHQGQARRISIVTTPEHGDRALRWLDRYRMPLVGFVLPIVNGDLQAAEDVVQETMLRGWQHAGELRREHAGSWLHTVARNIAISARLRVIGHLARCPACRADYDELVPLRRWLSRLSGPGLAPWAPGEWN